jgi:Cu(I)/Ag(I) efflux system membrane fusion protein
MRKATYIAVPVLMAICFLAGRHNSGRSVGATVNPHRILYYVDPMHPAYKSDKPGIAPDCGMKLEAVYADEEGAKGAGDESASMGMGTVHISPEQQQAIGLRVETVAESQGAPRVRLLGRVVADEGRVYRLNAATDGYIPDVYDHTTGSLISKGDELATFGATEVIAAQQSFVGATLRSPETSIEAANPDWKYQNIVVYSSRLRALGMSDKQISDLRKSLKIFETIQICSPVKGFILARNVSPGQRFEKGAELYRIADLTHVWIEADVYESDAQRYRSGTTAMVSLPNQKVRFHARVSEVPPQFDAATRTIKLRLEAENPGLVLRPDMFVDVDLPVHVPAALSVPMDSLLDSGMSKRVFIDRGDGYFEPREVQTGWQFEDRVQVVSGLAAGDRVVVAGTFLVDSESRLKAPRESVSQSANQDAMSAMGSEEHGARPQLKSAALPASAKDPSCGMDVKPAEAVAAGNTEQYRGETYYFCSSSCRNKFHKHPEHSMAMAAESSQGSKSDGTTP